MNPTVDKVLELESRLEQYTDCEMVITIKAQLTDIREAAKYLQCHVFEPFENPEIDYNYFRFKSERNKGLTIEVRSIENYRLKKVIEEI